MSRQLYSVEVIWADTLKHIASSSINAINAASALLMFSGHGAELRKVSKTMSQAKIGPYIYRVWKEC